MPTDEELRRDVERELEREPSYDGRRMGVSVDDGIVTLTVRSSPTPDEGNVVRTVERVEGETSFERMISAYFS